MAMRRWGKAPSNASQEAMRFDLMRMIASPRATADEMEKMERVIESVTEEDQAGNTPAQHKAQVKALVTL